jgi:hypothetical protein
MFDKEKTRKKKALLTVALNKPKGNGISAEGWWLNFLDPA